MMFVISYLLGGIDASATLFSMTAITLGAFIIPTINLYLATLGTKATARRGAAVLLLLFLAF